MNRNICIIGVALLSLLVAGCASDSEPIVFSSTARMPVAVADASPVSKGVSRGDEQKIDLVIFSYLLERHLTEDSNYSALFLQADDQVVKSMIKKFPNHLPLIKPGDRIDLRSSQSPLDRDTERPAMILAADVGAPNADDTIEVIGRWYAGSVVLGSRTFILRKTGGDWPILSVK